MSVLVTDRLVLRPPALAERLGARIDAGAATPDFGDGKTTLVYRHPRPESRA